MFMGWRLMEYEARLVGTGSRRLENAHRIALETEDVGADILRNLRGQREQIEHTRDTASLPLCYTHHGTVPSTCTDRLPR